VAIASQHAVKLRKDRGPGAIGEILEPLCTATAARELVRRVGDHQIDALALEPRKKRAGVAPNERHQPACLCALGAPAVVDLPARDASKSAAGVRVRAA